MFVFRLLLLQFFNIVVTLMLPKHCINKQQKLNLALDILFIISTFLSCLNEELETQLFKRATWSPVIFSYLKIYLGEGRCSIVYSGETINSAEPVALKFFR